MADRIINVQIRRADKNLIGDAIRIGQQPADDLAGLKKQVATLAKCLAEVAQHCADTDKALETLINSAAFSQRK
jgi:hypothetical protein